MLRDSEFMEKAGKINIVNAGMRTAFLFSIDYVEFRLVNHYYGMERGNDLLTKTEAFLNNIKEVQACSRVYANQFVFAAVMEHPYTDDEIIEFWEKNSCEFIKEQCEKYPLCNLKISCGICSMDGSDLTVTIDNAAMARKESRKMLGHRAVVYSPVLMDRLKERQKKEQEIQSAMRDERFTYYLQPIVDLVTGSIVGAEALSRMVSPEGGIIYPDAFLPVMEEDGTVVDMDYIILRKVCERLADRIKKGLPVVRTSVNLSRCHIQHRDTADKIHSITESYGLQAELFDFELTETIPLNELSDARYLIDKLRDYRYRVSIDDYGSGYTGISVWQDLTFDNLKMDRKFLMDDDALKIKNNVLIPNTIDIARKLNINVICEGLERPDQYEWLMRWGCKNAQGFYFSPAVPPEEFYRHYEETDGYYELPVSVKFKKDENEK